MDIIRIYAEVFSRNFASQTVLEKNGFQLEGTMRRVFISMAKSKMPISMLY